MANKMLIDASHQEETRVVVVRGSRIEEFDFESEHKKQLKGNIYLAKVTRVEPSLQAAFVEYGGNRHGFLAFSEIHPDYYQIPVADRQALIEDDLARAQEDEESEERKSEKPKGRGRRGARPAAARLESEGGDSVSEAVSTDESGEDGAAAERSGEDERTHEASIGEDASAGDGDDNHSDEAGDDEVSEAGNSLGEEGDGEQRGGRRRRARGRSRHGDDDNGGESGDEEADQVEEIGSEDAMEEVPVRQSRPRRQYKIQEVIKRRQILLVQVVKEERGNKGAALTTYLSLAGRYSVLMPNTARGGGISRKITNAADRKRLKEVARDLEVPRGMGIILRTAGANRTKAEVKRDYEYLMRLWETVRNLTLSSTAPSLVYEEGSLIKRSIRDLYNKDIDQILVAGEDGYREAKDFMRMLMPSQAKVVQPYRDPTPIFTRQGIEAQLDRMLQPHVTLKSGGYIIINQTEALVAIDVNSGRSTREHSVEDTAYQTNLEAAEEVARQLRLRDLAGLIVIDFIDMEEKRNNRNVEKRVKDCLKDDRARIQLGRISHFGLMEMSRQRIRASVLESTMQNCPTCGGAGHIRSASSLALHVLRSIEEHLQKHSSHDVIVKVPTATALYVLNEKRSTIADLERFHGLRIMIEADEGLGHQGIQIEHGAEAVRREPRLEYVHPETIVAEEILDEQAMADEATAETAAADAAPEVRADTTEEHSDNASRGRKRRRRRRRNDEDEVSASAEDGGFEEGDAETGEEDGEDEGSSERETSEDDESGRARKRRRRGRRGGRKNRDDGDAGDEGASIGGSSMAAEGATSGPQGEPRAEAAEPLGERSEPAAGAAARGDAGEALVEEDGGMPVQDNAPLAAADAGDEAGDRPYAPQGANPAFAEAAATGQPAEANNDDGDVRLAEAPPEPQVTSSAPDVEDDAESDKPKRTGWWARRSFF